jgi:hypothetical protein
MMEPWQVARQDQIEATMRTFADVSQAVYHAYQAQGFTDGQAFEIVRIWNQQFAILACITT